MRKVFMVVRREYLERVRKKSFWIGTLVFPLLMTLLIFGQFALMKFNPDEQRAVAIIDQTGRLAEPVKHKLETAKMKDGRPEFAIEVADDRGEPEATVRQLEQRVSDGDLFGILRIGDDLEAENNFRFYGRNLGNPMALSRIENALHDAVVELRFERSRVAVDPGLLSRLMGAVDLETFQVSKPGETKKKSFSETYFGTFAFVMLLYMALLLYGIAVMRGILEEKSNRVMEVLLGSLTPDQLMTGKILGIGLVGLTQMGVYALTAGALRFYVAASGIEADWTAALDAFSALKLFYFLIFFLLGYFFYTALFAAVGAVCNSEQEAQNLQSPLVMCLVIPMVATFFFVANPDSTIAVIASLIPIFTPMVMFMRISVLTPPFWQIGLSMVLMCGAIWLLFRGVAKVFRIGVLMHGKRPTISEILRWARS